MSRFAYVCIPDPRILKDFPELALKMPIYDLEMKEGKMYILPGPVQVVDLDVATTVTMESSE